MSFCRRFSCWSRWSSSLLQSFQSVQCHFVAISPVTRSHRPLSIIALFEKNHRPHRAFWKKPSLPSPPPSFYYRPATSLCGQWASQAGDTSIWIITPLHERLGMVWIHHLNPLDSGFPTHSRPPHALLTLAASLALQSEDRSTDLYTVRFVHWAQETAGYTSNRDTDAQGGEAGDTSHSRRDVDAQGEAVGTRSRRRRHRRQQLISLPWSTTRVNCSSEKAFKKSSVSICLWIWPNSNNNTRKTLEKHRINWFFNHITTITITWHMLPTSSVITQNWCYCCCRSHTMLPHCNNVMMRGCLSSGRR